MIKKLFLILLLFSVSFSASLAEDLNNINTPKQNGPTSSPKIEGPKLSPPTQTEIKKLKCEKDVDFIGTKYCEDKKEIKKGF
ncbi:MAG TPA: hypothetical protein EYG72_02140 [Candidatus Pacebacteria bacterium]|nr:hypothetical protein [Candidatus Paceibacterota bacterium]HIP34375.1 hypothetical protein [Bacteroidia bacterium]